MIRHSALRIACLLGFCAAGLFAQDVILLYSGVAPGSEPESYPEKQYFSTVWNTEVVSNVTKPSLTVYKPAARTGVGNAIVICPGGGFMALSIQNEGIEVANWLTARGITAFVLKYRLAHTGEDATQEFRTAFENKTLGPTLAKIVPLSIADGLAAVAYVRKHAADWDIAPDRVGIIGFSAGGTIAAAVGMRYGPEGRPAFVAPIYAAAGMLNGLSVPADAPPMFLAAASDDNLGLAPDSIGLYSRWAAAHKSVELHMYAKGGHGFGMKKQAIPTDHWIDRFGDWLDAQGWFKK